MDTPATGPIRILLVDDHALVREGFASLVNGEKDMQVVAQAGSAAKAITLLATVRPDVAIVDLRMPGDGGIELIVEAKRLDVPTRYIVLTAYDDESGLLRAFQAGAHGFLLKGSSPAEIMHAIRAVHAGQRLQPADLDQRLRQRTHGPTLTRREREVVAEMARGAVNRDIAATLGIAEETVKSHVVAILAKLGAADRTAAVAIAVKHGLIE